MVSSIHLDENRPGEPLKLCLEYIGEVSYVDLGYMNTLATGPRYNFDAFEQ